MDRELGKLKSLTFTEEEKALSQEIGQVRRDTHEIRQYTADQAL